ncbi:MAG: protein kinase [Planctomycetaceae bacterium]|nr:protein kinase [Planctomycetota bacterium]NUN51291.1 protein kinase [Planctomycetaceae bacterium]
MAELSVTCPKCQASNSVALGAEVEVYTCKGCGAENPLVDTGPVEAAVDPLVGAVISECKIIEKLGEGGFGAVYKAIDQNLQRPVALKVMLQSLTSSQEFVQKFIREAITAAQLNHPNIVAIHKVGRDEKRGIHYLIMELLEGKTLESIVHDKGVLKPEEGVPLILQAAEALAAAHDKKIVHRDIKPENIMVDKRGVVKIMDFGLAKVVQPDMKSTKVMGTPHYMSPEQFEGKQVDGRTDIYSLGVTLYYILSRARPYEGTNTVQIIYAILTSDPKSLLEANPNVPADLWTIVQKMIAKKVDERYADFREVRKDLLAYQEKTLADRITCPQCGARNQRGKKFCRQCGGNLQIKCPACGVDEVAGAQVCNACGAAIETLMAVKQNMERALRLKSVGDLRRAYLLLKEVLKLDPKNAEAQREVDEIDVALREVESVRSEALELEKTGNLEDALKKVEELLGRYPGSDDIKRQRDVIKRAFDARIIVQHMRRADEAIAGGNLQAALVALDAALRLGPDREDILARRRDLDARVQAAEQARTQAREAFEAKRYPEAFRRATEVLRANPTDAEMAQVLEKCRGYLESSEEFVRRGREHLDAGQLAEARKELEAAVALRPGDVEVEKMLAEVESRLARFRDLLSEARTALGDARWSDARTRVNEVLKVIPGDPEALGLMATIARQEQEATKAGEVRASLEQGEALERKGDFEGALNAYRRAVDADPDSGKAVQARDRLESRMREVSSIRSLADEHLRDGRFEEALHSLEKLRKLLPDDQAIQGEAEEAREKVKHIQDGLRRAEKGAAERNHAAVVAAAKDVLDLSPNHVRAQALKRDAERALAAIERHVKEAERLIGSEVFEDALEQLKKARTKGASEEAVRDLEKTAVGGITAALKIEATRFYSARDYGAALDAYERILELRADDGDAKKGKNEAERRLRTLTSEPMTLRGVVAAAAAVVLLMFQYAAVQFRQAPPLNRPGVSVGPAANLQKTLDVKALLAAEGAGYSEAVTRLWEQQGRQEGTASTDFTDSMRISERVLPVLIGVAGEVENPLEALKGLQAVDAALLEDAAFREVRAKAAAEAVERLTASLLRRIDELAKDRPKEASDLLSACLAPELDAEGLKSTRASTLAKEAGLRKYSVDAKKIIRGFMDDAKASGALADWLMVGTVVAEQVDRLPKGEEADRLKAGFLADYRAAWLAELKAQVASATEPDAFGRAVEEAGAFVETFGIWDGGEQDRLIEDLQSGR